MRTIECEKVVMVDIDDTLILWGSTGKGNEVTFKDPHSKDLVTVYKHDNNIRLLKEKHHRGYTIIVWSAGGYAHARSVVKALKLERYIDLVLTKPVCYIDDKPVCDWFPKRVWLDPEARYKDAIE